MTTATLAEPAHTPARPLSDTIAVEVNDVTKVFTSRPGLFNRKKIGKRVVAVDHISLTVHKGEIFGVLGPNGTGKSTLIRLMSTLLMPDTGSVRIFGFDVEKDEAEVKRLINRVSVEASFFKKLSPMENLMYGARLYSVEPGLARRRIAEILRSLGIEEHSIWSPMEDMSRGMQQKVAIARAFLTAPVLLLLDEPTTGLDPHSKREVQAAVREIRATHDATVLLTTHDMQEADELCDRIAIVDTGRVVALDTPAALKAIVREPGGPEPSLEDVFLKLTGKKLEDADKVD
ncbi:MAG: ABC transporter [Anaerolinea sp.]|nr:ABC transporter [Anaerolinea sp.]